MSGKLFRKVAGLWLCWLVIILAFQEIVPARLQMQPPDYALPWTSGETRPHSQDTKPYLNDPFLNTHVTWDSEFYLSIATTGYDDPKVRAIRVERGAAAIVSPREATPPLGGSPNNRPLSLNYAFMPFYPLVVRLFAFPARIFGLDPIAAATLAGIVVSALGTLAGMFSLLDLTLDELGEEGGLRAAFYLVIFPTGFFLAQVYTEGLFIGLAFGSMALARRRQWVWAALLAVLATWTRAVGVALVIPMALPLAHELWSRFKAKRPLLKPVVRDLAVRALLDLLPVGAYLVWHFSFWGQAFGIVESAYFKRGAFVIGQTASAWAGALQGMFGSNTQQTVYYAFELFGLVLGVAATAFTLRRYPSIALFGLVVLVVSFTSGEPQGMLRYVLVMPAIFLALSRLGKSPMFDRAWSLASTLFMGMTAVLFMFNMWAG